MKGTFPSLLNNITYVALGEVFSDSLGFGAKMTQHLTHSDIFQPLDYLRGEANLGANYLAIMRTLHMEVGSIQIPNYLQNGRNDD
jgi:hypothetical protein